jgi:N-acetylglucosamine kinase-like BadF-type ATPase
VSTILGLDMGGSRTRARLVRDGATGAEATGGGSNIAALGSAEVGRRLAAVLSDLGNPTVDACCAGAAGSEEPKARQDLAHLLRDLLPGARVQVVHDSRLVLAAANLASGIALIAGTGSVAYGRNAAGQEARAGGWGWLLGDDGGGSWIVREAARAVLSRADAGPSPGPLAEALMRACGVTEPVGLAWALHRRDEPEQWADLAGTVFAATEADPDALAIVGQAAEILAGLVLQVDQRLGKPGAVVLAGGLLLHQRLLEDAVRARLLAHELSVVRLENQPVAGAVLLARELFRDAS